MKPVPVDVQKGLYKQEEQSCNEKVQDLMYKIHEKNSHATHIRDLEVYKKDDGAWSSCYRLKYGLEIAR
ncbi:hypothetical protein LEP1GSC058_1804 [Leptospira fainei serovar Hurstbridge str. BUT 6]|uniref:Uncharacterized protein n=1 Tax=Leptospira fainei serovar Hurstbridge str. BUT 6 TaxID=1193011 RepID=S3W348_9LEPT|nr:hypothetical protein [Leptospira fainei]EPG74697.1 hypothetical protein LEP1GSC058_1804 [Leptospira fainei serovar Hurstbridge str. BUT 6]